MGYYCTVPQCTSLAGKTKNVKFHRFPRDDAMAMKWNVILKRMKPITKYSKVCSLHFTQADYNVTTMGKNKGQWKTLSKDAVPTQNLPKLNPDGTVMVIRKSRTSVKYKGDKKDDNSQSSHQEYYSIEKEKMPMESQSMKTESMNPDPSTEAQIAIAPQASILASRLQGLNSPEKPKTQDAIMQTDPLTDDESPKYESPKYVYPDDYLKNKEYLPQTTEEYNKEAEKYALERKSSTFESFQKTVDFSKEKSQDNFEKDVYQKMDYDLYYQDSAEMLRNQQQNIQMLQEQHRMNENQNFFDENHIKQEVEVYAEDDKFFEGGKETVEEAIYENHSIMQQTEEEVKQEPEVSNNTGSETIIQPQQFFNTHEQQLTDPLYLSRPGPELLIAKQNALAAHAQLWQNTKKRPFFYSDNNQCTAAPLMHRYEDLSRILQ